MDLSCVLLLLLTILLVVVVLLAVVVLLVLVVYGLARGTAILLGTPEGVAFQMPNVWMAWAY